VIGIEEPELDTRIPAVVDRPLLSQLSVSDAKKHRLLKPACAGKSEVDVS